MRGSGRSPLKLAAVVLFGNLEKSAMRKPESAVITSAQLVFAPSVLGGGIGTEVIAISSCA
jgi:hypothetical protein